MLGTRIASNPIIAHHDVSPSRPEFEVLGVSNPAAVKVGDEVILLLRVAERPRTDVEPPDDALTLDFDGPEPVLKPLPEGFRHHEVIGMVFMDTRSGERTPVVAYLPRDLPGLDLSDPRTIRYRAASSLRRYQDGYLDYLSSMSHLRVARSRDGIHFDIEKKPALFPAMELEEYGIEDARACQIDGVWQITYVSVSRLGITTSRATTPDFKTFTRAGVMFLPDHKDVVLFPERIGGRYFALTRPMPQSFGQMRGIWMATSDDLVRWGDHRPVALPRWEHWDEIRTGGSCVPIRTDAGWLELYHGVDRNGRYAMGGLLMALDDPFNVLARSPEPILMPKEPYEHVGLYGNVVFSCGHVPLDERGERIRMYYGAADSCVAAADFSVGEILASLRPVSSTDRFVRD